jgi:hypothetical protein
MKEYSADIYCHVITIRVKAKDKRSAKKKIRAKLKKRSAARLVDWNQTDIETNDY